MNRIIKPLVIIATTGYLALNPIEIFANGDSSKNQNPSCKPNKGYTLKKRQENKKVVNDSNRGFFVRAGPFISQGELVNKLYGPGPEVEFGWDLFRNQGIGASLAMGGIFLTGNNSFSESRYGFLSRDKYVETQDLTYLNFMLRVYGSLMNRKNSKTDLIGPYFAVEGRAFALGERFVVTEEKSGLFSGSSYRSTESIWKPGFGLGAALGVEFGDEDLRLNLEGKYWAGKIDKKEVGGTSVNVGLRYSLKKRN